MIEEYYCVSKALKHGHRIKGKKVGKGTIVTKQRVNLKNFNNFQA